MERGICPRPGRAVVGLVSILANLRELLCLFVLHVGQGTIYRHKRLNTNQFQDIRYHTVMWYLAVVLKQVMLYGRETVKRRDIPADTFVSAP